MQGFNMGRYVPPDLEGVTTGNKLANKHPLGARARHLRTSGALVVRFEMPFAIWCTSCKPRETLIGQGVRFNAEKKKVGNYYSTPVYSFRMKHAACGGWIEIRTDPKNTAYVVVEGARKRETGEDDSREDRESLGEIRIRLPGEEREKREDAFARLEGKVEDKRQAETAATRILELQRRQGRDWEDPYERSKRLRRAFRAERKALQRKEERSEALRDKMSLGIELVEETEEDRLRAAMVDFGANAPQGEEAARATRLRPMFERGASSGTTSAGAMEKKKKKHGPTGGKQAKATDLLAQRKAALRNELTGNTRAVVDPFLNDDGTAWEPDIKRRRLTPISRPLTPTTNKAEGSHAHGTIPLLDHVSTAIPAEASVDDARPGQVPVAPAALVNYASDSD